MTTNALASQSRQASSGAVNVGDIERLVSVVGGGALVLTGLAGRSGLGKLLLPLVGGMLVYRGMSGHCSLYSSMGLNTAEPTGEATSVRAGHGFKVEESITIRRPVEEVYSFWRKLEQLPRFMGHLREVRVLDQHRSHWVAKAPLGMSMEWDAEIINDGPNDVIAWRSLEGSAVDTAGSVHFRRAGNGGTEVHVSLKYDPPGGKVGSWFAWLLGQAPEQQIREDLRRLQQMLEAGGTSAPQMQMAGRS